MNIEAYLSALKIGEVAVTKKILGGNSSVYKGILNDGTFIAIKKYKGDKRRVERMLSREHDAVNFLRNNGISNIPELLEVRKDLGLIVFSWVEGITPPSSSKSMNAILEMCSALNEIYMSGSVFKNAIDPGFSGFAIESQIRSRTQQLESFYPFEWITDVTNQISKRLDIYNSNPQKDIIFHQRTLSFSDLGTHNMIYSDGRFSFIDFEFFGIDSMYKMLGDFLLHPRNEFARLEMARFVELLDKIFEWRLEDFEGFLPLLTLKWSVIAYGRTLRDLPRGLSSGTYKKEIMKSKGALYLDYFDWLCLSGNTQKFVTFRTFEDMVTR